MAGLDGRQNHIRDVAAGVPEDRQGYRPKTSLALEMLERALERGDLKAGWVAGDDAFGMSPSFRDALESLGMWYVGPSGGLHGVASGA